MRVVITEEILPDVIGTGCQNSLKIKDVDFPVPCGKCILCQKKRRADWSFRLQQEFNHSDSAFFITLTYNDLYLPFSYRKSYQETNYETGEKTQKFKIQYTDKPTLNKKHIQDYIKRLRKDHVNYVSKELKISKKDVKKVSKPIRYYAVGEYGSKTDRPHYHLLLFNYDVANLTPISKQWKYGFTQIGTVTGASINYVTKYMHKDFDRKTDSRQYPFSQMSRGSKITNTSIIGYQYLEENGSYHIETEDLTVKDNKGNTQRLPKAFLKRLFTNKEDRQEVSKRSFDEYQENKLKEFRRLLETKYNNDLIKYMQSKDSDLKRKLKTINNRETL